jgi:flagellar hook-associated protein 3 FlgL
MRISTNLFHNQGINSIQKHQGDVLETQLKLSTGKRVNKPSDDPVAINQIHSLNRTMNTIDQYAKNGEFAKSQLVLEETAISDTINSLQRARELGIQMLNGTYNEDNRLAAAQEIDQITKQVANMMNYTNSEGEKLFAGNNVFANQAFIKDPDNLAGGFYKYIGSGDIGGATPPAAGDELAMYGARFVQIGFDDDNTINPDDLGDPSRVRITDNGAKVFLVDENIDHTTLDFTTGVDNNVLNTLVNMSHILKEDGLETAIAGTGGTPPTLDDIVNQFDSAISNLSQVRAEIGGRQNRIETQFDAGESFKLALEERRQTLEEQDLVEGITDLTKYQNALQMSQQIFTRVQGLSLFNYLR